jgi:thiol:disulfide interchange protein
VKIIAVLKKYFFLIALTALVGAIVFANHQTPPPEGGIDFHKGTVKEAFDLAKRENKPVFIDVYAVWCGPCRLLKQYTFTDTTLGNYFNQNFVNLALDGEKGEGIGVAQSLSVRAYPTLAVITPGGEVILKIEGYYSPEQLLEIGKKAVAHYSEMKPQE